MITGFLDWVKMFQEDLISIWMDEREQAVRNAQTRTEEQKASIKNYRTCVKKDLSFLIERDGIDFRLMLLLF